MEKFENKGPSKSAPASHVLQQTIKLKYNKHCGLFRKNSLCVAVMIFNIYVHVNNEYSDSAIY